VNSKIVIIGGGVGGLTLAASLQRLGFDAHVYEAAASLSPIGGGIWLPTNAMLVFDRLGLAGAVEDAGMPLSQAELIDVADGPLQSIDLARVASRFGFTTVAIHRHRLHQILASALQPGTLHLGSLCDRVSTDGDQAEVLFSDESTVAADVVVGADGQHSRVRELLFPSSRLRYGGQSTWRGIADLQLGPALQGVCREIWGGRARFGFSALSDEQVYWFAPMVQQAGRRLGRNEARAELAQDFAHFPDPVSSILAATRPENLLQTDVYDLKPLSCWWRGRAVLLGDAAHSATPDLGQGGAHAVEDAWVLAETLSRYDNHEHAFEEYERLQSSRAYRIVAMSRRLGKLAHMEEGALRKLRNAVLRAMPASLAAKRFDAISPAPG
jgi:2-polyprenyl-6-methoxyphenol hydroxylase-like FAD-dependent oxidoreductase